MSKKLTSYEVLIPTSIENLYKKSDIFSYETEEYNSKTPEYIKELLVKSRQYPLNIRVIMAK